MKDPVDLQIGDKCFKRLISAQDIECRVKLLADQIKTNIGNLNCPIFICVLKGAFVFVSDFIRHYGGNCEVEFLRLASYKGSCSSGKVKTLLGMDFEKVRGRKVIILEDIIETGLTMENLLSTLEKYNPESVEIATLFLKENKLCHDIKIGYCCFTIPDKFIVGYGLDYNGLYRNLPAIYTMQ